MEKQEMIDNILSNDAILSRTAQTGTGNTDASISKLQLRLTGEALTEAVNKNRLAGIDYIFGSPAGILFTGHDLFAAVLTLASLTNRDMLPAGLFRVWRLPADRQFGPACDSIEILPSKIWSSLESICESLVNQLSEGCDAIEVAATIEWHIGIGPLHPFYDACGRISRLASALILQLSEIPIKKHSSREEYFKAGKCGIENFVNYYRTLD